MKFITLNSTYRSLIFSESRWFKLFLDNLGTEKYQHSSGVRLNYIFSSYVRQSLNNQYLSEVCVAIALKGHRAGSILQYLLHHSWVIPEKTNDTAFSVCLFDRPALHAVLKRVSHLYDGGQRYRGRKSDRTLGFNPQLDVCLITKAKAIIL